MELPIDEAVEATRCDCTACLSVALSVLSLEVDPPLAGWGWAATATRKRTRR